MSTAVKLSFGVFELGTPTLRRWTRIIAVLDPQGNDTVLNALSAVLAEDAAPGVVGLTLLPILTQLPELGFEFVDACLRDREGAPVPVGTAEEATDEDLLVVIEALASNGTFERILNLLKNRIPLALKKLQNPDGDSDSDRGKSQGASKV